MIQTNWVIERLHQQWPGLEIHVEQIRTMGDRVTTVPLTQIGGDGVFVREIEIALQERRIDLAVHSLKDLPTVQPEGLHIVVAGSREDVRDVLIARSPLHLSSFDLLPAEAATASLCIGTSSLRRTAQLRALYSEARIASIRGNVDTRLRKLEEGDYDAIVLAAAGLKRMAMQEQLAERLIFFPIDVLLPAPGQGALALESRDEPHMHALLVPLHDTSVQVTTTAERMFMRRLGAGCYLPVAAYAELGDGMLALQGLVMSLDGQRAIRVQQSIDWTDETPDELAESLGIHVAELALAQGAYTIIHEIDAFREQEHERV